MIFLIIVPFAFVTYFISEYFLKITMRFLKKINPERYRVLDETYPKRWAWFLAMMSCYYLITNYFHLFR